MKIETKFELGDKVQVEVFPKFISGYVSGFYVDDAGTVSANIRHVDTAGCVKVNYFLETQLAAISD